MSNTANKFVLALFGAHNDHFTCGVIALMIFLDASAFSVLINSSFWHRMPRVKNKKKKSKFYAALIHRSLLLYFCSAIIICLSLFWFSQPFS